MKVREKRVDSAVSSHCAGLRLQLRSALHGQCTLFDRNWISLVDIAQSVAPYARVKAYLKRELARGRWKPRTQMPSESELVRQFRVSRMTVNRALRELQSEGLVNRVQGVGTFAAQLHRVSSTLTIHDLHQEIVERGHQHDTEVHLAREEKATAAVAQRLGVKPGGRVFHTLMVHREAGVPLQCEDRYVNPECAPEYLSVDFTKMTPTHYLLEVAPSWEAQYAIEANTPTVQEAKLLKIGRSKPCLIIVRRTANQGTPITYVRLVHPGSRYQIEGHFKP